MIHFPIRKFGKNRNKPLMTAQTKRNDGSCFAVAQAMAFCNGVQWNLDHKAHCGSFFFLWGLILSFYEKHTDSKEENWKQKQNWKVSPKQTVLETDLGLNSCFPKKKQPHIAPWKATWFFRQQQWKSSDKQITFFCGDVHYPLWENKRAGIDAECNYCKCLNKFHFKDFAFSASKCKWMLFSNPVLQIKIKTNRNGKISRKGFFAVAHTNRKKWPPLQSLLWPMACKLGNYAMTSFFVRH